MQLIDDASARAGKDPLAEPSVHDVVVEAAAGAAGAWEELTRRFGGMIIAIARSCRLGEADAWEVHQTTWLRLVENIGRIEHPERIGAWLATTAKRECLRMVRNRSPLAFDEDTLARLVDDTLLDLDARPLAEEQSVVLRAAFAQLPPRCQRLLTYLSGEESPSYKQASAALSMPIGSIGPTRGRCLEHLRKIIHELGHDL
ncbi:MAG TPA: sigma-70 family RNA polymerase sigma factor [Acidimicrobiales bacterium]|jgi:RNA polymerase sigma factor (sigma-70 family)